MGKLVINEPMVSWLDGVCETQYLSLGQWWRLQSDLHLMSLGLWWQWHEAQCAERTGAAETWPLTGHLRNREIYAELKHIVCVHLLSILAKLIMFEAANKSIVLSILFQ